MLSSRQQARRQERLDAVLAAAWEIAAESGLGAVTLHDVEQLGDAMLEQITSLFSAEDIRMTRKEMRRRAA